MTLQQSTPGEQPRSTAARVHPGDGGALHRVVGEVEHGNAWGRVLGFPTANIPLDSSGADLDGVWAGIATFAADGVEHRYVTAVSVGTRPTYYADGVLLLEALLLDFEGDLYRRTLTVALHRRIRGQVAYTGSEALIAQLEVDVAEVRAWAAAAAVG